MNKLLEIIDLKKSFESNNNRLDVLKGISFDVYEGDFITIMGSSGSGKTTLLNCISTIDQPTEGGIYLQKKSLVNTNQNILSKYRLDYISFIFQNYNLIDTLTVYENIVLPLQLKKVNLKESMKRICQVMDELEILNLKNKFPSEISGGQQQRVAAARAIISNAKILIADEPTGALDSLNSQKLMELLSNLNHQISLTILMVTHDPLVAKYSDKILMIKDGRICGVIERQKDESDADYVNRIINSQKKLVEQVM
ncbi:ABC transporter ATP-binding protein [Staphylococcus simulans]